MGASHKYVRVGFMAHPRLGVFFDFCFFLSPFQKSKKFFCCGPGPIKSQNIFLMLFNSLCRFFSGLGFFSCSSLLFISPELVRDANHVPGNFSSFLLFVSPFVLPLFLFLAFVSLALYMFYLPKRSVVLGGTYAKKHFSLFTMRHFLFVLATYLSLALPFADTLVEFIYCFIALNVAVYSTMLCGSRASVYAALCYFLLGSVATSFLFAGLGVWVSVFGGVSFHYVSGYFYNNALLSVYGVCTNFFVPSIACCFVFIPLFFKLGIFPFHFYLPMVYGSVGRGALFVITIPVKLGVLVSFFNFIDLFFPVLVNLQLFFWVVGIASVLVGAFAAAAETNWRRFWGYSYMNNMGTALLGLSFYGDVSNTSASLYYVLVYLFQWFLVWLLGCVVIRWVSASVEHSRTHEITYLSQLSDVGRYSFCRLALLPILISMAGIPPMLSFWAKFGVFINILSQGTPGSLFVFFVALLVVPLNAFNYMRLVRLLSFQKPHTTSKPVFRTGSARPHVVLTPINLAIIQFVAFVNAAMLFVPITIFLLEYCPSMHYLFSTLFVVGGTSNGAIWSFILFCLA